jgi:hypothetical protein
MACTEQTLPSGFDVSAGALLPIPSFFDFGIHMSFMPDSFLENLIVPKDLLAQLR